MLYLILCYSFITGICLWMGIIIYSYAPSPKTSNRPIINYLITGLIALTAFGQWIVLFLPLNWRSLFLVIICCGIVTAYRGKYLWDVFLKCRLELLNKAPFFYVCLFCFLAMILVLNAGPVIMDDTDSYHIQMVKWVQEYGSVPGIANLHLRFGLNSSWFISIGLLSYPFRGLNTYTALNGLLSFWFCFFILQKMFFYFEREGSFKSKNVAIGCVVLLLICTVNWPMIRGSATSSNYDFITTICVIVLFITFFEDSNDPGIEWLIWPVYLFTVRMINAPLILLSIIYGVYYFRLHGFGRTMILLWIGLFLIVPFLARNVVLSGYAFFPVYQLDWFSFDWKADKSGLIQISEYIKYFNRVNAGFSALSETRALSFTQWISHWYIYLYRFDKIIVTLSIISYSYIFMHFRSFFSFLQRCFAGVMFIQLICWFFSAPDPRFVQGSLLFGIYAALLIIPLNPKKFYAGLKLFTVSLSALVLVYGLLKIAGENKYHNFIRPLALPSPAVQIVVIDHIKMRIPFRILNNWNPRCYDIDLPCLYRIDPRLTARGVHIGDGFRLKADSLHKAVESEYKITE